MKGQFAPVRGPYSPLFKQVILHFKWINFEIIIKYVKWIFVQLVRDLLQRDPEFRPSASEVLLSKLPSLLVQFESK